MDLAEAKLHLRATWSNDDSLIQGLIAAATEYAEDYIHKSIVSARWKQVLDGFPGQMISGIDFGQTNARPANAIYLEIGYLLNPPTIQYLDTGLVLRTLGIDDDVQLVVDTSNDPGRITPIYGQIWPISAPQIAAVSVLYDAGYATRITADATADSITVRGPWSTLVIGSTLRLSNSGGALPAPLQPMTDYYVRSVVSPGVYTLSETSGGSLIDITDAGTGTSYIGVVPEGIKTWMKLRLAALFENREEIGTIADIGSLPFVDQLLDGYKSWQF
jgi:hypothetical protein